MRPDIRFLAAQDGVRIAYCTHGSGAPLVFVRGWMSHLENMWEISHIRAFFEALAEHFLLVRYDARGNGLSDRDVERLDLDALTSDLEALMDELALSDAVLFGSTFGGPIALTYAARHPERVAKLVLEGTYARGRELGTEEQQKALVSALETLGSAGYHLLELMARPEPHAEAHERVQQAQQSISRETAVKLYTLAYEMDVSPLLPQIQAPTLVLHRRQSASVRFELGRRLAAQLPNARFVPLEGRAHNLWDGDTGAALATIGDFLGVPLRLKEPPAAEVDAGQPPLTVLFTDMEGSTTLTQRLGDAKAQDVLRTHNTIVRDALKGHGGSEIKHTGDGIMASFPSASRALDCAIAIQRTVAAQVAEHADMPLRVRIGLNAGEPVAEDQDLFGTAVQLAARVCAQAEPDEILVSEGVRQIVAGKGFLFSDRGDVVLRGFEDPVRLYEVRWVP